jgi:hypothetical protein
VVGLVVGKSKKIGKFEKISGGSIGIWQVAFLKKQGVGGCAT